MSKPERLEDLGRIREILSSLIERLDEKFSCTLESKHDYETFEKYLLGSNKLPEDSDDSIYELHLFLRGHKERLQDVLYIAIGDQFDE